MQEEKELDPLIDLGTCGLHVVHGSMKACAKASEWQLQKLLKAMCQFIHDAPARQAMYKNISESTEYPAKFCGHHWRENEKCAEKAESLIKEYQKFVTHVSGNKSKSFTVLKKMIHDPLIFAKLKFFEIVSHKLNAVLQGFQTDSPMVPFFVDVLGGIVHDLLEGIILKNVLHKATNLYQLVQIDPQIKTSGSLLLISILVLLPTSKLRNLILTQMIPKFLLLKKRLEAFLLHCCHTFLKSYH